MICPIFHVSQVQAVNQRTLRLFVGVDVYLVSWQHSFSSLRKLSFLPPSL